MSDSMSKFTPRAQQVLALARKEAERFSHNLVGTEHLLLGLIKFGQGVAVNVLQKLGIDLEVIRKDVEKEIGTGPDQKIEALIPFSPRVKKVLALAGKEASMLNHTYVGTEHILLGLIREGDGVAAKVLKALDVGLEQTRQEILKELDPNLVSSPGAPHRPPTLLQREDDHLASCIYSLWSSFKDGDGPARMLVLSTVLRVILESNDAELVSRLFEIPMPNRDWIEIIAGYVRQHGRRDTIQSLFDQSKDGTTRYEALCAVLELATGEVPKQMVVAQSTLTRFPSRAPQESTRPDHPVADRDAGPTPANNE